MVLGEREVVEVRGAVDVDGAARGHPAVRVGDVIDQVRRLELVAEEVKLAGARAALGMGGHRAGDGPGKVEWTDRGQLGIQLERQVGLDERQQAPRVLDHVRVVAATPETPGARAARLGGRPDIPISVPPRASAGYRHAVHHAVADEPVRRCPRTRIGAVAHVAAIELPWQLALDGQVRRRPLDRDGREVA